MSVYLENGYKNRKDYLESVAEDTGHDIYTVMTLAQILGSNEDFDGLLTMLEDLDND
jgi:hypothetical protein